MKESILNPQGLKASIENRRARLCKWLHMNTRPAYMEGVFVGPKFRDYGSVVCFLALIPEESRRERVKCMLDKIIRPFQMGLLLPAAHADEILDHSAGIL